MVTSKPNFFAKGLQIGGAARAALAEAEIGADDDMRDAKPFGQHVAREGFGREGGKGGVEGQLVEVLDAQLGQPVGAGLGIHQAEGRGVGGEEFARVRFEGDDAQRGPGRRARSITARWPRCTPSKLPMATEAPRCIRVKPLPVLVNLHLPPLAGGVCPVSRTCGWAPEPAPRPSGQRYYPLRSGFQGSPGAGRGRWR